eukprot:TRINITY_DN14356_c0_g1_i1.p1 TRINITY_DN14356_c0_g1~~TRINITY_DN14356_c0_g1_i1.p1  ORF type:complete len:684 (+),score=117.11 TRINITY_DN14356_c0_g1_i1:45-2096(+)
MSVLAKLVRRQVSIDKRRYTCDGYDLDFTYITDRIIAMAFPAEGVESIYRNPIDDVASLLIDKHGEHFMIFNLSERSYDYAKFNHQVIEFGFPDHHSPSLQLLLIICKSIHSHLMSDPRNVAVVHCMAGKGRTGTTIAAYMIFSGLFNDAEEALDHFGRQRSVHSIGVTVPSQLRYVRYMYNICTGVLPHPKPFHLKKIIMNGVPRFHSTNGCRPFIEVYLSDKLIYSSAPTEQHIMELRLVSQSEPHVVFGIDKIVRGDLYVRFYHGTKGKGVYMCRFQVHTGFLAPDAPMIRFTKAELDDAQKDKRFDDEFIVDVFFQQMTDEIIEPEMSDNFDYKVVVDSSLRGSSCYNTSYLSSADLTANSMGDEVKSDVLALSWKTNRILYSDRLQQRINLVESTNDHIYCGHDDGSVTRLGIRKGSKDVFGGYGSPPVGIIELVDEVVIAYQNGTVRSFKVQDRSLSWEIQAHKQALTAIMRIRQLFFTSSMDGFLKSWDLGKKGAYVSDIACDYGIVSFSISDDIATVLTEANSLISFNLSTKEQLGVCEGVLRAPRKVLIGEDLAYTFDRNMVLVMKVLTGEVVRSFQYDSNILDLAVHNSVVIVHLVDRIAVTEIRRATDTCSFFIKANFVNFHGDKLVISQDCQVDVVEIQKQLRAHIPRRQSRTTAATTAKTTPRGKSPQRK